MPKRTTTENDPISDLDRTEQPGETPSIQPDVPPPSPAIADQHRGTLATLKDTAQRLTHRPALTPSEQVRRATGGRLELLGGSFGTGTAVIRRFGDEGRIGFVSPAGERVDLEAEVESVASTPDQEEHRLLGAAGWAVALGALAGPFAAALGGGLRLLHPKRMILDLRLRDGRMLTVRTDSVTSAALQALATSAGARERAA
jgi:hypothetical protein